MVNVLAFKGDARQIVADNIDEQYEGLLHSILIEFFIKENLTLCYFFDINEQDFERIFVHKDDWLINNAIKLKGTEGKLSNVIGTEYFLTHNIEDRILGDKDSYYISKYKSSDGQILFQNIEPLLEYRTIIIKYEIKDEYGFKIQKERKYKKYSIRIDDGNWSGPVDFDSLEELKEIIKTEYNAKQLIPITYTPWDSKDYNLKQACKIEDLALLYLYEFNVFEVRKY